MKSGSPLLVIFLTVFIDLIGFGICLPLLPKYAERYGAQGWQIGAAMGVYSLMQLVFAPWWGQLSDRIGRRPVLLVSNFGSIIAYGLFGLSASYIGDTGFWILIGSRIFAGICGANLSVASAYIADVTTPEKRSKGMGLIGMAFGLGFILGPVIGSQAFKHFGLAGPGAVAAGICAINFLLGCFILPETRKKDAAPAIRRPRLAQIRHVLGMKEVGFLIGIYFLGTFAFTAFESTLPLLLDAKLHYDEEHVGYVFAFCGIMAAMVQGGGIGRLVKSFGERRLIGASLLVVAVSLVLMPLANSLTTMLAALAVFAIGSGINRAPTMGLISQLSPADEQGTTLGIAQSAGTLARVLGPTVATTLYDLWLPAPYLACATIALLAGLLAVLRLMGSTPKSPSA
ncbi:MAG: MFS transporter [Pedosphaera sp.]|nr:MFS transporter [Pedosphaera sp.]